MSAPPGAICPWCRYDVTSIAPADGTLTCPECGKTCTPIEAAASGRAAAERPAAFTREAILGGSVGAFLAALGAFAIWALGVGDAWIVGIDLAIWASSIALGSMGWFVAAYRARDRGSPLWLLAAGSMVLAWIAAVHAAAAVIVVIVIAARV